MKIHNFTVRGSGRFPLDMLRHGRAWPKAGVDSEKMAVNMGNVHVREINLEAIAEPHRGRWESFGWCIVNIAT